jgi:hypothetical protein
MQNKSYEQPTQSDSSYLRQGNNMVMGRKALWLRQARKHIIIIMQPLQNNKKPPLESKKNKD